MAKRRTARLNEQVRRELTALLQTEVRDPRIGLVTITGVEVSPDLYHAKVFFSVLGSEEERSSALEGMRAAAGFLRTEIGRRMHIRRSPELHFTYDSTLQHAMHIEKLLKEARASSAPPAPAGDATADDAHAEDDSGSSVRLDTGDDREHAGD
jgi:ribosome-binding factor A